MKFMTVVSALVFMANAQSVQASDSQPPLYDKYTYEDYVYRYASMFLHNIQTHHLLGDRYCAIKMLREHGDPSVFHFSGNEWPTEESLLEVEERWNVVRGLAEDDPKRAFLLETEGLWNPWRNEPKKHAECYGLQNLPSQPGSGVTIGVLDNFPTDLTLRNTPLHRDGKIINADFNGSADQSDPVTLTVHGIAVADISVKEATHAKLELFDLRSLTKEKKIVCILKEFDLLCFSQVLIDSFPAYIKGQEEAYAEKLKANPFLQLSIPMDPIRFIESNSIFKTNCSVVNISSALSVEGLKNFQMDTIAALPAFLQDYMLYCALPDMDILQVTSIGNDGIYLSTSDRHPLLVACAKTNRTRESIILVGSVLVDGLTLSRFTNQPGDDVELQARTLVAQGTHVPCFSLAINDYTQLNGTSFSAPKVSGAAAIIRSAYPSFTAKQVSQCLLEGATPILLRPTALPNPALGEPYELTDCEAGNALVIHPELQDEILNGRRKYGMGRLNVAGALFLAGMIQDDMEQEGIL